MEPEKKSNCQLLMITTVEEAWSEQLNPPLPCIVNTYCVSVKLRENVTH